MNIKLEPGKRSGVVTAPPSKSQAHRMFIAAALGSSETEIVCSTISDDVRATMDCLKAFGARITDEGAGLFTVKPIEAIPEGVCCLPCGESGSTLRFLLPVAAALGVRAEFQMRGRLPERPIEQLAGLLCDHGALIEKDGAVLRLDGRLSAGSYSIPGDVSSQYISGLLLALPLLMGDSELIITETVESSAYIKMTEEALSLAGVKFTKTGAGYKIPGSQKGVLPARITVEGDFSGAAFFLCAGALAEQGITVKGLKTGSAQPDEAVIELLRGFGAQVSVSADSVTVKKGQLKAQSFSVGEIPDIVPELSVVAAVAEGVTHINGAGRLHLKESDRLKATAKLITDLGGDVTELEDGLIIRGKPLLFGGAADSFSDHRIAMSAAVASCACSQSVEISGSECVKKSYPAFWEDFASLDLRKE